MKRGLAWLLPLGAIATLLSFPFPPPVLTLLLAEIVVALLVIGGVWAGARHGLGSQIPSSKRIGLSLLIGTVFGAVVLALLPLAGLQSRIIKEASIPVWKWLIIAFDSSVLEEIVFRLFLMSFAVWALARFLRRETAITIALILSALLFGAAHLNRWLDAGSLAIAAVMAVNGAISVALGLVYVKWGIESAMIAHFAGDVIVHIAGPHFFS